MPSIDRRYPGRSAAQIYDRVDEVMERIAAEMGLAYRTDEVRRTGVVTKMGITGSYTVVDGAVTLDLAYPLLIPASLRRKVEEKIARELDGLFA